MGLLHPPPAPPSFGGNDIVPETGASYVQAVHDSYLVIFILEQTLQQARSPMAFSHPGRWIQQAVAQRGCVPILAVLHHALTIQQTYGSFPMSNTLLSSPHVSRQTSMPAFLLKRDLRNTGPALPCRRLWTSRKLAQMIARKRILPLRRRLSALTRIRLPGRVCSNDAPLALLRPHALARTKVLLTTIGRLPRPSTPPYGGDGGLVGSLD
jgi:hypothetical protein